MNTDKIYAEQLANEYAPKDTSKVVALRKLDNKAKLPATIFTYTFGIITALVAGEGMCLSMKVIGSGATAMFVLGVNGALRYWRNYGGFDMVMITEDNEVICTSGLVEVFELTNTKDYTSRFTEYG